MKSVREICTFGQFMPNFWIPGHFMAFLAACICILCLSNCLLRGQIMLFQRPFIAKSHTREAEESKKKKKRKAEEEEDSFPSPDELEKQLERIKWYLWHGNAHNALSRLEELKDDLAWVEEVSHPSRNSSKPFVSFMCISRTINHFW